MKAQGVWCSCAFVYFSRCGEMIWWRMGKWGMFWNRLFWKLNRGVRTELPPASGAGDFRAVPLSLRKNAKGGENWTQLASLRQVSHFLQRILPRAKRKPCPKIHAPVSGGSSALGGGWVEGMCWECTLKEGKLFGKGTGESGKKDLWGCERK